LDVFEHAADVKKVGIYLSDWGLPRSQNFSPGPVTPPFLGCWYAQR